ncbi:sugar ABC transporter permease [Aggregatilineales bacterium SYSU G02658]
MATKAAALPQLVDNTSILTRLFRALLPYLLIAPTLLGVFTFTLLPAVRTVHDSLYQPPRMARGEPTFVGLENYASLFNPQHHLGARFGQILGNTLAFSLATVGVSVPIGLGMALLLNRRIRAMGFWRFAVFYPSLLPLIGAASIWAFLYADTVGLINTTLRALGLPTNNWLGNPNTVLASIITVDIWKQSGYHMLFFLAGLQAIPQDLYEAAELDGASYWQQLTALTLPLLRRTLLFVLVVALTFSFQTVEQLGALGMGKPADRGNLLLYFIFQNIGERRNWGYINAMSVILAGMLLVFTVTNFFLLEQGREDER